MVSKGMASAQNFLADRWKLADALPNLKKCCRSAMLIQ